MRLLKPLCYWTVVILALTGCTSTEERPGDLAGVQESGASTSSYPNGDAVTGTDIRGLNTDSTMMEGSLMDDNGPQLGSNAALMGGAFADPNSPLSVQVIYFKYDSSDVREDFIGVIAAHSQYLSAHPNQQVRLEGHADERGSPEYNVALSEQRAQSVSHALAKSGVSRDQYDLLSYGEEKPAAFGRDESSWQLNRRVEIIYQAR